MVEEMEEAGQVKRITIPRSGQAPEVPGLVMLRSPPKPTEVLPSPPSPADPSPPVPVDASPLDPVDTQGDPPVNSEQPAPKRRRVIYLMPSEHGIWFKIHRALGVRSEKVDAWFVSKTPVVDLTPETNLGSQPELAAIERFHQAGLILPVEGKELHFRLAIHPALIDVEQIKSRRTMEVSKSRYGTLRTIQGEYDSEAPTGTTPYEHFVNWIKTKFPGKRGTTEGVIFLNYREGDMTGLGVVRSFQGKKGERHHVSMEGLEAYTFVETDGSNHLVEDGTAPSVRNPAPRAPSPVPIPVLSIPVAGPSVSRLAEALAAVRGEIADRDRRIGALQIQKRVIEDEIAGVEGERVTLAAREQSLDALVDEEAKLLLRIAEALSVDKK